MRLLAFYPYVPYPLDRGAYYRGFYLLRELARAHEVDLLALTENGEGDPCRPVFLEFCRRVEFVPFQHPPWPRLIPDRLFHSLPATVAHWSLPKIGQALTKRLADETYDAVHVFDLILAQYLCDRNPPVPWIVDRTRVDLQYQLMEGRHMRAGLKTRLLAWENLSKLWWFERKAARRGHRQVVCGQDDAAFLRRWVDRSLELVVIPNGVDLEYFHPGSAPAEPRAARPTLLFCGAMDYNPNVDALRWYFAEIHEPLRAAVPDLELWVVGKEPIPEIQAYASRPGVTVTGAVPDVRPYYRRAWLQMVPLRIGGGTRLKIVESLAMGTPVVSTTIGAQGLDLRHNHDVLLADSAPAFLAETVRALKDSGLRRQLETDGLDTASQRFSWISLGRKLNESYTRCGRHRPLRSEPLIA
jgi:glycosyltransferase involved in cell wall biosynthesis